MKKDIFNEWYKESFNRFREEPPAEVWEEIENELDVQEVWDRVDDKLSVDSYRQVLRRRLAWAASVLVLIAAGVLLKYPLLNEGQLANRMSPVYTSPSYFEIAQPSNNSIAKPNTNNVHLPSNTETPVNGKQGNPSADPNSNAGQDSGVSSIASVTTNNSHASNENVSYPGEPELLLNTNILSTEEPVLLSPIVQNELAAETVASELASSITVDVPGGAFVSTYRPVSPGFSVGPVAALNNVWLLNQATIEGLKNTALYQADLTFGGAYGITSVYDTRGKWGVQADMLFDTQQGQKYHYYEEGAYATKIISAHYYQLNTLARRKKAGRFFRTSLACSRVWTFGPEVRWMKSLLIDINKPSVITTSNVASAQARKKQEETTYSKFDFGVHTGFEYELQVSSRFVITSGLQASIGLNNINRGGSGEGGKFNNTYNAAAGVQLGARYMLSSN